MSTLTVDKVQVNDYIECVKNKVKGIVNRVMKQWDDKYYIELVTEEGRKSLYLNLTDEIMKGIAPKSMLNAAVRYNIENLYKTVQSIGSDPEIFVVDDKDELIPAYLFLKAKEDKDETEKANIIGSQVSDSYGQNIFWDGFQAEFNLYGAGCLSWVVDSAYHGLYAVLKRAKKYNKDARLTIKTIMDIPPHLIFDGKEEHVQFGCMPSYNVYNLKGLTAKGQDVFFRSTGGHIHFGLNDTQKKKIPEYVRALDAILGVACVSMFGSYDDPRRREYYGLAGEYRTPNHGLEYRTLSNAWMCHPAIMNIVFEMSRQCIAMVDKGLMKHWEADEEEVLEAINGCNIPLACEILKRNEQVFKSLIMSICYRSPDTTNVIYNTFMLGVEHLIENPDDIKGNWGLDKTWHGHCEGEGKKIGSLNYLPNYKKLIKDQV